MTGQTVDERVRRMMKHGIIKGFRTVMDEELFDPERVESDSQESLDGLLNDIVVFANYQINSVIKKHK